MDIFEQFGITQKILEGAIIFGIVTYLLYTFWRPLVFGAGMLFVIFVFASHKSPVDAKPVPLSTVVESPKVEEVKPDAKVEEVKPEEKSPSEKDKQVAEWHREFMEDCLTVSENTKEQCETIWQERLLEEGNFEKVKARWALYSKTKARQVKISYRL